MNSYNKHAKRIIFSLLWAIILLSPVFGQVSQSHSIVIGFIQLKDQSNLGMVFNGVQLEYRYGLQWEINDHVILYQPKLGLGVGFNHGLIAAQMNIAPINVTWTMPFYEQNRHTIRGGVNFITDYNYQVYVNYHSTNLFWTNEIGLSPIIRYSYQWDNKRINAALQNSLLGFTSHTKGYDTYFRSTYPRDFFVKPHENLNFGSFNNYDHTNVSLEFIPDIFKMHSFVYEFDYLGFFKGMQFHRINHNFLWRMSL